MVLIADKCNFFQLDEKSQIDRIKPGENWLVHCAYEVAYQSHCGSLSGIKRNIARSQEVITE